MISFELKQGMIDQEIYNLLDGKISGEGTEQIQLFMYPRHEDFKDKPEVLHSVIKSNEKYAIIKKAKTLWSQVQYYLTGINDEGWYFLHDLPNDVQPEKNSIDDILKRINFVNDGFERIQGDILLRFIDMDDLEIIEEATPQFTYTFKGFFKKNIVDKKINPISLYPKTVKIQKPFYGMFFDSSYYIGHIGNHKVLLKNGKSLHRPGNNSILIFGESFSLKHNEHRFVEYDIPKRKVALLTMQQSRTKLGED